ncbi:acyltransferase family protein [Xylophilus rhododendri]|uniref:Acyltransferase family protein n=1 Tax=Xylophilus rhododendri TaxID=2697032 RepID=A0A857JDI6_9BURK|nr:acyltransferase [Xylophilus rhododendri]QHJ01023.1 acyltransferase family protein [Xylophilus rhododendri]
MPFISLQHLRGIAALLVVCVHLQLQLERMDYHGWWPSWGYTGVDIFFVLSGFLMWHTTVGRQQGPLSFYRRRLVRIAPLYWLLTSVVVAVLVAAPQLLQSARLDWLKVAGSYLFFFTPSAGGRVDPVLVVGWTLNYEMLFYLVYGAALLLPAAWRFWATTATIALLVALGLGGWATRPVAQAYTSSIMLEFVFGMAVARWWQGAVGREGPAWTGPCLLLAGFAALMAFAEHGPTVPSALATGLPATMVVAGALLWERSGRLPAWRGLRWLGDISYSVYLSHPIVLSAFSQLWRRLGLHLLPGGTWLFAVAAVLVCVAVGELVYRWLELPMTRRLGAFTGARVERSAAREG